MLLRVCNWCYNCPRKRRASLIIDLITAAQTKPELFWYLPNMLSIILRVEFLHLFSLAVTKTDEHTSTNLQFRVHLPLIRWTKRKIIIYTVVSGFQVVKTDSMSIAQCFVFFNRHSQEISCSNSTREDSFEWVVCNLIMFRTNRKITALIFFHWIAFQIVDSVKNLEFWYCCHFAVEWGWELFNQILWLALGVVPLISTLNASNEWRVFRL